LIDPLNLVIDDAEHLDEAEGSLRLVSELIRAELPTLRIAVAGRRSLALRVAKPRAAGRLAEMDESELGFDAEECAALLRLRGGREPLPEEIEDVMSATQGWPLGIALIAPHLGTEGARNGPLGLREMRSAEDLRSFFSEEFLESLQPELREGAIISSVARVVTPAVIRSLDLPDTFSEQIARAGMLVRDVDGGGAFTYHPLLREFLMERLVAERGAEERRRLHGAVAQVVADGGDSSAAIEHWLKAQNWTEAVSAIERDGPLLVRTSAGLLTHWLTLLPEEARATPTIRSLEGQLAWASGDNTKAIGALQDAIRGFKEHPNAPADWLARSVLTDSLFATGGIEALDEVVAGWDQPEAEPAGGLAPAALMYAAVVLAAFAQFAESERLADAARSHPYPELVGPLDALRSAFADGPTGDLDKTLATVEAADRELQRFDPLNRRPHLLGAVAVVLADRGEVDRALGVWVQIRGIVRGGIAPLLADATHAWCALLHAQAGRLAEAEAELAQHRRHETGFRAYVGDVAPAVVASLRGDSAETLEHAERALTTVDGGPILFRSWAVADLVPALAGVGHEDRAEEVLEQTVEQLDEMLPGSLGRLHRGRLVALRAWMRHNEGDSARADADLLEFWNVGEVSLRFTLCREWERLQPVVWSALERGSLDPEPAIEAISEAFPDGLALVAFVEHPVPEVRRAALAPATHSGAPEVLAHLYRLAKDPDPELAAGASQAAERLARTMPPLRFELLGDFVVGRGSWRVGEGWGRPVDARLVRFLLANLDSAVPEDEIFEALWPELSPASARNSLQTATSRARRVLDPPGATKSVIESVDRRYRLVLGVDNRVDAEEFRSAAEVALACDDAGDRQRLLVRARALWGGEPLAEERYSDWAAAYRERLNDRYTAVLAALLEIHERAGEHTEVADVARELVNLDSLNEGGHRALITAYARTGRTGHALRQYLECRRALVEQIGVEPSAATSVLQARILAGESV
jgi:DNA-binding SARP family transcriptional activator